MTVGRSEVDGSGSRSPGPSARLRSWTSVGPAVLLVVVGALPIWGRGQPSSPSIALVAAALLLRRRAPLAALAAAWAAGIWQTAFEDLPSVVDLAFGVVIFSTAASRDRRVTLLSAASVLVAGMIGGVRFGVYGHRLPPLRIGQFLVEDARASVSIALYAVLPLLFLGACWIGGFAVRSRGERSVAVAARRSAEESAVLAEEVARLATREREVEHLRAELARDVHDVIGHSLAVIILQADALRFVDDRERERRMAAEIAETARRSLGEVRQVLSQMDRSDEDRMEQVVARAVSSGVRLTTATTGDAGPLPPQVAPIAAQVLRELLTNAIRHGRQPIRLHSDWTDGRLTMEVSNAVAARDVLTAASTEGRGMRGMRARLRIVGGQLETVEERTSFTARVTLPRAP